MDERRSDRDAEDDAVPGHPGVTVVGIDVGTTNTKVALVDADGRVLRTTSFPTPSDLPTLLGGVERAVRPLVDGLDPAPRAIGIASMAETGTALDRDDEPLLPLVRWDRGGTAASGGLPDGLDQVALHRTTGLAPTAKAPLATWSVLATEQPDVLRRMHRWVGVADALVLHLTGSAVTDHTLALRTMAVRLPAPGASAPDRYDEALLAAVGMAPDRLSRIARPGSVAGTVTRTAALRCGLAEGTPVVVAGHDHAVAAWAVGMRGPGPAVVSVGTSEALVRCAGPTGVDRSRTTGSGMSIGRTVDGARETLLAGAPSGGAMAAWLSSVTGADGLALLADPARSAGGVVVAPYPRGRQTPDPDPEARVRVTRGDPSVLLDDPAAWLRGDAAGAEVDPHDLSPDVLARAVVDGLAAHLAWMDRVQRSLLEVPGQADAVLLVGGPAAANRAWARARAAALGVPVLPVRCAEPVATGAALLAAVRTGVTPASTVVDGVPSTAVPASGAGLPGAGPGPAPPTPEPAPGDPADHHLDERNAR